MSEPNVPLAIECLKVALDTINEWTPDASGHVYVSTDVVRKAVVAAMVNLGAEPEGENKS